MSLEQELEKHVNEPRREQLKMDAERLDTAIKMFEEIIELAEDDRMEAFLNVVLKKKERAERILLAVNTTSQVREQAIGEMRALDAIYNWKQYYLNAITQGKEDLKIATKELETGERPDDTPND